VSAAMWVLAILACGAGATVRFLIAHLDPEARFPWTTIVSNTVGSAVLGAAAAALAGGAGASAGLIVGAGFAGGLSTYSTLAVDAVVLANARRAGAFLVYLAATLGAGLAAGLAGYAAWSALAP
jgi:CrcB protein